MAEELFERWSSKLTDLVSKMDVSGAQVVEGKLLLEKRAQSQQALSQKRNATFEFPGACRSGSTAILEFQWIEIRCTVKVINVFDSFEPRRYFKCYRQ